MKWIFVFLLIFFLLLSTPVVLAQPLAPALDHVSNNILAQGEEHWSQMIEDLTKSIKLNPEDVELYNRRGIAQCKLRKWDLALSDYQKALELDPNSQLALTNQSLVLFELGKNEEALKSLQEIVRKYPMLSDARAALTALLWYSGYQGEAESNWVSAVGLDKRYGDRDWIANTKNWPPKIVAALDQFINFN